MKEGEVERRDVHGLPWHPGTFPLCLDGIVGGERSTLVAPAVWIRQLARTCSCNGEWFTAAGRFCSVPDHRGIVRGGAMRWCMVWSPNLLQRPVAAHGPWAANVSLCVEMDQPRSLRASSAGPAFFFFCIAELNGDGVPWCGGPVVAGTENRWAVAPPLRRWRSL